MGKLLAGLLLLSGSVYAHSSLWDVPTRDIKPLPIGNFALSTALMPSPLFSLGQNIVDRGDVVGYISPNILHGKQDKNFFYNEIYTLFGISNSLSFFILFPVPAIYEQEQVKVSGFGDIIMQAEYAFYNRSDYHSLTQATAVASLFLPSGVFDATQIDILSHHAPFIGLGSTGFFVGGTWSRTTYDWYTFISGGSLLTTAHNENKIGRSLFYQAGIGRNLTYYDDKILMAMLEFDGISFKRDRLQGVINPDSGGTIMYLGPSFYLATTNTIFQMGFQIPCYQKLNGTQAKNSFLISISFAWLMRHIEP